MHRHAFKRLRTAITLAALAVGLLSWAAFAQPASAATQTFAFTGFEQPYMVPAGVHSVHVIAVGAKGGRGSDTDTDIGGSPGFGARIEADLPVTPGQVLFIEVGGTGADGGGVGGGGAGGFNGGGSSNDGVFGHPGGGGGGATDIRTCSRLAAGCALAPDTLTSRLVVAGGGGGGGDIGHELQPSGGDGGDAGKDGQTGQSMGCSGTTPGGGGGAGTQSAGGAGGFAGNFGAPPGNPGVSGQGGGAGTSSTNSEPGGGGGGGYFGGGAGGGANGCAAGGGGGGSSFAAAAASGFSETIDVTVPPQVVISTNRDFSFGRLKRNKRTGTAHLIVDVPSPGILTLTGTGLVPQRVSVAGRVKLSVRTKGKARRRLNRIGKLHVAAKVTYMPSAGEATSKVRKIKLAKRRASPLR